MKNGKRFPRNKTKMMSMSILKCENIYSRNSELQAKHEKEILMKIMFYFHSVEINQLLIISQRSPAIFIPFELIHLKDNAGA